MSILFETGRVRWDGMFLQWHDDQGCVSVRRKRSNLTQRDLGDVLRMLVRGGCTIQSVTPVDDPLPRIYIDTPPGPVL